MHFLYYLKKKSFAQLEKDLKEKENHWAISLKMALVSLSSQLLISFIQQVAFVGLTVEQGRRLIEKRKETTLILCTATSCTYKWWQKHSGSNEPPAPSLFLRASTAPPSEAIFAVRLPKRRNNRQPRGPFSFVMLVPRRFLPAASRLPATRGPASEVVVIAYVQIHVEGLAVAVPVGREHVLVEGPVHAYGCRKEEGEVSATALPQ